MFECPHEVNYTSHDKYNGKNKVSLCEWYFISTYMWIYLVYIFSYFILLFLTSYAPTVLVFIFLTISYQYYIVKKCCKDKK